MKNYVFNATLILLFASSSLLAQGVHQSGDKHTENQHVEDSHSFKHHRIALFTGYALNGGAIDTDGDK